VFATTLHFLSNLIFACKAGAYQSVALYNSSLLVGS
jgi:hypothetical protein